MSYSIYETGERETVFQLVSPVPPASLGLYSSDQINIVEEKTLTVRTEQIVTFSSELIIAQTRQYLRTQLSSSDVEDILYRVEATDRDPGFIIDFLILIPESNRETKRAIFSAIGDLMRTYPHLLIDFRIAKRNGRAQSTVIPEGYTS